MLSFCSHRQRHIRRSSHYIAGKRPEEIPRFQSSSCFQEGMLIFPSLVVRNEAGMLWSRLQALAFLESSQSALLRAQILVPPASLDGAAVRYLTLSWPHGPRSSPLQRISKKTKAEARSALVCFTCLRWPRCLFLSGMLEAVYCFTGERFTEETLRNTEMD